MAQHRQRPGQQRSFSHRRYHGARHRHIALEGVVLRVSRGVRSRARIEAHRTRHSMPVEFVSSVLSVFSVLSVLSVLSALSVFAQQAPRGATGDGGVDEEETQERGDEAAFHCAVN